MAASKDDLRRWFDQGVEKGATHMAVFMDIMDYEDYPSYFDANKTPDIKAEIRKNPERVMEIYDLRMDREEQMAEFRAFHY